MYQPVYAMIYFKVGDLVVSKDTNIKYLVKAVGADSIVIKEESGSLPAFFINEFRLHNFVIYNPVLHDYKFNYQESLS